MSARNTAFLMSVVTDELPHGYGWAVTLTVGETPATAAEWHAARKALLRVLRNEGVELVHWVVEWTAKGRPHLHMAAFGDPDVERLALTTWLSICDRRGWPAAYKAQHVVRIRDSLGWLQYVAKHAARGAGNYQRMGAPEGWQTTGRLWGQTGPWPVSEGVSYELTDPQFWVYRRLMWRYQRARYRSLGMHRAVRNVGKGGRNRSTGRIAGVSGWIPEDVSNSMLLYAIADTGYAGQYNWETN